MATSPAVSGDDRACSASCPGVSSKRLNRPEEARRSLRSGVPFSFQAFKPFSKSASKKVMAPGSCATPCAVCQDRIVRPDCDVVRGPDREHEEQGHATQPGQGKPHARLRTKFAPFYTGCAGGETGWMPGGRLGLGCVMNPSLVAIRPA